MSKSGHLIIVCLFFMLGLSFASPSWAAEYKCAVCNMKISENSKHHIVLKNDNQEPLHVCSLSCVHKAQKYKGKFSKMEVSEFNHPEKLIPADKAFVLIKSEKIKEDLDSMAMPPFFAAFSLKADAEAAQKKYGDGVVVEGLESALR